MHVCTVTAHLLQFGRTVHMAAGPPYGPMSQVFESYGNTFNSPHPKSRLCVTNRAANNTIVLFALDTYPDNQHSSTGYVLVVQITAQGNPIASTGCK